VIFNFSTEILESFFFFGIVIRIYFEVDALECRFFIGLPTWRSAARDCADVAKEREIGGFNIATLFDPQRIHF
jgi:hypothetical protein